MGKRGPKPGMGGRPKSPIVEKIANGNPGKRPLTVLDFKNSASDLEGKPMPKPSEYLSAEQKNGTQFFAVEIYEATWNWLKDCGCESLVNPHVLEEYAMCKARWIQCENLNSEFGFLAKHPTTGAAIASPYVTIANTYFNQFTRLWADINQVVKENCTTEYSGTKPNDTMEALLQMRERK